MERGERGKQWATCFPSCFSPGSRQRSYFRGRDLATEKAALRSLQQRLRRLCSAWRATSAFQHSRQARPKPGALFMRSERRVSEGTHGRITRGQSLFMLACSAVSAAFFPIPFAVLRNAFTALNMYALRNLTNWVSTTWNLLEITERFLLRKFFLCGHFSSFEVLI